MDNGFLSWLDSSLTERGEFLKKMVVLCQQGFYKVI